MFRITRSIRYGSHNLRLQWKFAILNDGFCIMVVYLHGAIVTVTLNVFNFIINKEFIVEHVSATKVPSSE